MSDSGGKMIPDYEVLVREIARLAPVSGTFSLAGAGEIVRRNVPARAENVLCRASISLAIQGRRSVSAGGETREYGCGQYILNCVDVPCVMHGPGGEEPFLALSMNLDPALFARIYGDLEALDEPSSEDGPPDEHDEANAGTGQSLCVGTITPDLFHVFQRLVRLSDDPKLARFVVPLLRQELHCYLALGPYCKILRAFYASSGQSVLIVRAESFMREHCGERLRIETLARMVNMGESTFNRNFKKVTSLSPLQYHKHLKLYEARRLMAEEGMSAASACFAVGYESQQQFTREYKRLFGAPPMKDVRRNS